jgi:predicted small lipoprotein YifL
MRRIAQLMPVAVLALVVLTMLVACGGKGGGY